MSLSLEERLTAKIAEITQQEQEFMQKANAELAALAFTKQTLITLRDGEPVPPDAAVATDAAETVPAA